MANVLDNLAADLYTAADVVSRELTGFIPAVTINANGSERVAKNGTVRSHFTRAAVAGDRNVAMQVSEGTDQTVDTKTVTIDKDRSVEIPWTGEDTKHVDNGAGFETIYGDQVAQAMRTLTNEIEADLASAAHLGASRAYGTAGTTPFATAGDFTDASFVKKILVDNGAGEFGHQLIMNTSAGATLQGKQASANVAGTDSLQRQGILLPLSGMDLRQSSAIINFTKGAMASATTNAAGYAIGATIITLATAGTGLVSAGDVITFAGDTNQYVIASVVFAGAAPAAGDVITLQEPGLRVAITTAATAITVVGSSARNIAFRRSAIELVMRPPALPKIGGVVQDAAVDRMMIIDPISGIPFEAAVYLGQGKAMLQIALAWGKTVWKPEHTAALLG
jgi:hypothetical protein